MKTSTVSLVLLLAPAALFAQAGAQAGAQAASSVVARKGGASVAGAAGVAAADDFRAPKGFSADGSARLEAMYADAKAHHVPREPIARRVDEGRAKGASESRILVSAAKVKANLEASHDAMVEAGRAHPSDEETERGEAAMERGVTKEQIRAIAEAASDDRSLVVAFDVLARLAARGVPVGQAVAEVQSNVGRGDSDASLNGLVSAAAARGAMTGSAAGNGTVTTRTVGSTVGTTVGATIGGVIKKP